MNSQDLNEIAQLNQSRFLTQQLNLQDQPTSQQVLQKAEQLQIDDLILARESLTKQLDPQWKPYCNRYVEQVAYRDHPVDMYFKKIYAKNNELSVPKFKTYKIEEIARSMDLIDTQIRNYMVLKYNTKLKTVYEQPSQEQAVSQRVRAQININQFGQRFQQDTKRLQLNVQQLHELHQYQKQLQQQYTKIYKKKKQQIEHKIQQRKKQHEQVLTKIINAEVSQICQQYEQEIKYKNKLDMKKQKQKLEIQYQSKRMEYSENIYKFNRTFQLFRDKQRNARQIYQTKNAAQRLMMIQAIKEQNDLQKYKMLENVKNKIIQQFNEKIIQVLSTNRAYQKPIGRQHRIFNQNKNKDIKQGLKTLHRSYRMSLRDEQIQINKLKRDIKYQQMKKEINSVSVWENDMDRLNDTFKMEYVNLHKPSLNLRLRMRII